MQNKTLTLGSLFSGSGGFELAGMLAGIEPIWASEIEPYPIRVTTKRLPQVRHYGDVAKLNGADLPPVDIITFGSPCQDMSVAGKRTGLAGEQSGLFHEAIRIVKEMREKTDGDKPRYIVWENVTGSFSSNGGTDYKAVLEAVIGIKEPGTEVPPPDQNGWPHADVYLGDGWSLAYRVFDARYWGVPQSRTRIFLVADFGGERAGDILFKSEGLSGYSAESFEAWKAAARSAEGCTDKAVGGFAAYGIDRATYNMGRNAKFDIMVKEELEPTMIARGAGAVAHPVYTTSKSFYHIDVKEDVANALIATDYKDPPTVSEDPYYIVRRLTPIECARLQGFPDWWCSDLGTENPTEEEISFWADVFEEHRQVVTHAGKPKTRNQIVKWLKDPHSDSAAYRLWGNGLALPCAWFVLAGIVHYAQYEE